MSDRIVVMRDGRIEQAGAPRDIFRRPRNRFVAEFIGETNLIDLTVEALEGGLAVGRAADGLALRFPAAGRTVGEAVAVTLRPTDFSLSGGPAAIEGRVASEVYLGADLHYFVRTGGGAEIRATARDEDARPEPGDAVTLYYDPARVHVLETG